jgi:hypothetical protein
MVKFVEEFNQAESGTVDLAAVKDVALSGKAAVCVCRLMGNSARPTFTVLSEILGAMYYDYFSHWSENRTDI